MRDALALSAKTGEPRAVHLARLGLAMMLVKAKRFADAEPLARDLVAALPAKIDGQAIAVDAIDLLARISVAAREARRGRGALRPHRPRRVPARARALEARRSRPLRRRPPPPRQGISGRRGRGAGARAAGGEA